MRIARFLSPLLGLAACAPAEGPAPRHAGPPGPPDPPDPSEEVDPGRCVLEQDVSSGAMHHAWRSPSGTTWALSNAPALRVRAPDGAWSEELAEPAVAGGRRIHGSDDDAVWVVSGEGAFRRLADGAWEDMGAPADAGELVTVHVAAPDDVTILRVVDENSGCLHCYTRHTPSLLRWDGAGWTEEVYPAIDSTVLDMAVLPDGTVVLADQRGLRTLGVHGEEVPIPADLLLTRVFAGADGTLVAIASSRVAIGGVDEGLSLVDPGAGSVGWHDAWVGGADDVWLSGTWTDLDEARYSTIAHWDGASWSLVLSDYPAAPLALAGGGGEVVAVGGGEHEVALAGDAGGLTVERDRALPGTLWRLAVDDVTGEAWSTGMSSPVLGVFRDGRWQGIPLEDRTLRPFQIAASGGRVALTHFEGLSVLEGGALTFTPGPAGYPMLFPLAGGGGAFFAAALPMPPETGFVLLREAGAGWEPMPTDGLPAGLSPRSLWADGADALWMGFLDSEGRGGLASWDGEGWTVQVDDLPKAADGLVRMGDGLLYFGQFEAMGVGDETLWTFDGAQAMPVPDLPTDVRGAHVMPDGTLVVSSLHPQDEITGHRAKVLQREPGGEWTELLSGGSFQLVGWEDTVWVGQGARGWTFLPCS